MHDNCRLRLVVMLRNAMLMDVPQEGHEMVMWARGSRAPAPGSRSDGQGPDFILSHDSSTHTVSADQSRLHFLPFFPLNEPL